MKQIGSQTSQGTGIEEIRRSVASEASPHEIALEQICRLHWQALYNFARRSGCSHADAEDSTQEFFGDLLGKQKYRSYDPRRGNIRSFLSASFRHFLIDKLRRKSALKRGGNAMHVPLEPGMEASREEVDESDKLIAQAVDQQWASEVMSRARKRLDQYFSDRKKAPLYQMIGGFLLAGVDNGDYGKVGEILNMTEPAIRNAVFRMRRRFRELLVEEIEASAADGSAPSEHLRYLLVLLLSKDS